MTIDWQHILDHYGPAVWRTVRSLLGNDADARDCYQTVFLEAFQFSEKTLVDDWSRLLGRIARVRSLDVLRRRYRRAEQVDGSASVAAAVCASSSVEDELNAKELSDHLRRALASISNEQAEAFLMRYVDQLTYDEIAERTGSNRNAVGAMLSRARTQLRNRLEDHGHGSMPENALMPERLRPATNVPDAGGAS